MALALFRAIRGNPCRARAQADSTFVQFNIVKLFCAILHGGDRDTLGAMACAVSGAYLGVEAIPQAWREKIENRQQMVWRSSLWR